MNTWKIFRNVEKINWRLPQGIPIEISGKSQEDFIEEFNKEYFNKSLHGF